MSEEIKMSDILLRAVDVVISRNGDTGTEDGDFACVDIDSIIHLEGELSKLFSLASDDINTSDIPLIKVKAEKYDRLTEENKRLREAIEQTIGWNEATSGRVEDIRLLLDALSELDGE